MTSTQQPDLPLGNAIAGGACLGTLKARGARGAQAAPLQLYFAAYPDDGSSGLASEYFVLTELSGEDRISDHFSYQLTLRALTRGDGASAPQLKPLSLVGCTASVAIPQPGESWTVGNYHQYVAQGGKAACQFHGIITSFGFSAPGIYQATLQPALYRLTLTNHYRVLYGSVADVIGQVLQAHGIAPTPASNPVDKPSAYYEMRVDALATERTQPWFQAGESDYEFIQRLMGKANLYYYYEHSSAGHTVVFSNLTPTSAVLPNSQPVYTFTSADPLGLHRNDVITDYNYCQRMTASGVQGVLLTQQANWAVLCETTAACTPYSAEAGIAGTSVAGAAPFSLMKTLAYGGDTDEAQTYVSQQARMLAASAATLSGSSGCGTFRSGLCFTMREGEHPGPEQIDPYLDGRGFALTSVKHKASLGGEYENSFEAIDLGPANVESAALSDGPLPTAFNPQATEQGNVLGVVVPGQPDSDDFLPLNAFQYSKGQLGFGSDAPVRAPGVMVKLAAPGAATIWVVVPAGSTTVPQVGSLVSITRAQNESELPELSRVIDSHGSLSVKAGEWDANTNVGNSYSTSYGDSQSIHYGGSSPGANDIGHAALFVTTAYNAPKALATNSAALAAAESIADAAVALGAPAAATTMPGLTTANQAPAVNQTSSSPSVTAQGTTGTQESRADSVSYSQGSSCSFSESDAGPDGLLSRNYSRGCTWSSDIAAWSRSYSIVGSKAAREANPAQPRAFGSSVVSGSQSWTHGDTARETYTWGNTSSTEETHGNAQSTSTMYGNSHSESTTHGIQKTVSNIVGASSSVNNVAGASSNVTDIAGASSNVSNIGGGSLNVSNVVGLDVSVSTFLGLKVAIDFVAAAKFEMHTCYGPSCVINNWSIEGETPEWAKDSSACSAAATLAAATETPPAGRRQVDNYGTALIRERNVLGDYRFTEKIVGGGAQRTTMVAGDASDQGKYAGAFQTSRQVAGEASIQSEYAGALQKSVKVAGDASNQAEYAGASQESVQVTGDATVAHNYLGAATLSRTCAGAATVARNYQGEATVETTYTGVATLTTNFIGESNIEVTAAVQNTTIEITAGVKSVTDLRPATLTSGAVAQTCETMVFL